MKKMKKLAKILAVFVVLGILSGCVYPYRTYGGYGYGYRCSKTETTYEKIPTRYGYKIIRKDKRVPCW